MPRVSDGYAKGKSTVGTLDFLRRHAMQAVLTQRLFAASTSLSPRLPFALPDTGDFGRPFATSAAPFGTWVSIGDGTDIPGIERRRPGNRPQTAGHAAFEATPPVSTMLELIAWIFRSALFIGLVLELERGHGGGESFRSEQMALGVTEMGACKRSPT